MSLSLITDTAAEVHRLTIAGSALASGDFRLRKLLPQLESLGAKAPVFGRIAQGVKAVTEEPDAATAGRALLDLATLLTAIQYTQSQHGAEGEFEPISSAVRSWTPTVAGYRSLAAVVEALTSTGEGRLEVVQEAAGRGLFADLRLMQPAIMALGDRFGQLADFVAEQAIPQFGPVVVPLLKAGFDPKGGVSHARRLRALAAVDREEGRACARAALKGATKEVKVAAIAALAGSKEDYETIVELSKDRVHEVRFAAIQALGSIGDPQAVGLANEILLEAKDGCDVRAREAAALIAKSGDGLVMAKCLDELERHLPRLEGDRLRCYWLLQCLEGVRTEAVRDRLVGFFRQVFAGIEKTASLNARRLGGEFESAEMEMLTGIASLLLAMDDRVADRVLFEVRTREFNELTWYALKASTRFMDAEGIFDAFAPLIREGPRLNSARAYLTSAGGRPSSYSGSAFPKELLSSRWVGLFMQGGCGKEVAMIAEPGQPEVEAFLKRYADWAGFRDSAESALYLTAFEPRKAIRVVFELLERLQERADATVGDGRFLWEALALLPASSLPYFEKAAATILPPFQSKFEQAYAKVRERTGADS
jgi:hypothetical protein